MTKLQPFHSVRSYYFRAECARIDWEHACYGGRSLDELDLDDFRSIFARATSKAVEYCRIRSLPAFSWRAR